MRTHLVSATGFACCAALAWLGGCGPGADTPAADEPTATPSETFIHIDPIFRYLTVVRDKPLYPGSGGGYLVHSVNTDEPTVHVATLDFSASGLDADTIHAVEQAPNGSLVVQGWINPATNPDHGPTLRVFDVYRGMPHIPAAPGDGFYIVQNQEPPIVCIRAPCPDHTAHTLNSQLTQSFASISVDHAASWKVDQAWLTSRVLDHGAVVAAHLDYADEERERTTAGHQLELDVSQVYLHLPDTAGPCPLVYHYCAPPYEATYTRDVNRCLVFTGCAALDCHDNQEPTCPEGYTPDTWPADNPVCMDYACDPDFVTE